MNHSSPASNHIVPRMRLECVALGQPASTSAHLSAPGAVTGSIALPPDRGQPHDHSATDVSQMPDKNDAGAHYARPRRLLHSYLRMSRLRSHPPAPRRGGRNDEISKYLGFFSGRTASANVARAQPEAIKRRKYRHEHCGREEPSATPGLANGRDLLSSDRFLRTQRPLRHIERMVSERRTTSSFRAVFSFSRERRASLIRISSSRFWGQKVGGFRSAIIPSSQQPYVPSRAP
ncbi:hypothetical protein ACVI1J_002485 [Bradyrhizobium diazoefficiens]